jgi:transposase-like protein
MPCAYCSSQETVKNGTGTRQGRQIQRYLCQTCGKRFNDWTNTPMARLRTPPELVSAAINVRTEGLEVRQRAAISWSVRGKSLPAAVELHR